MSLTVLSKEGPRRVSFETETISQEEDDKRAAKASERHRRKKQRKMERKEAQAKATRAMKSEMMSMVLEIIRDPKHIKYGRLKQALLDSKAMVEGRVTSAGGEIAEDEDDERAALEANARDDSHSFLRRWNVFQRDLGLQGTTPEEVFESFRDRYENQSMEQILAQRQRRVAFQNLSISGVTKSYLGYFRRVDGESESGDSKGYDDHLLQYVRSVSAGLLNPPPPADPAPAAAFASGAKKDGFIQ